MKQKDLNEELDKLLPSCVYLAKVSERPVSKVFLDFLRKAGYVVVSENEHETLKEKAWMYDELG